MIILGLLNNSNISLFVKYRIGETVYFIVYETRMILKGTVVKIDSVNDKEDGKSHVQYTIEEDYDKHELYEVSSENVADTLDNLLEKKRLKRFNCEVFMDRYWSLSESVIAETLDDAIASLKEKYPNAYTIRERDHWDWRKKIPYDSVNIRVIVTILIEI